MNKIKNLFKKGNSLNELKKQGLIVGKNFNCYSINGLDHMFPWLIKIGDDVTISTDVTILTHDSSTYFVGAHTRIGLVNIGNNVFIGTKCVILPNVKIGNNVIIGASSVVTKNIPSNSVVAGTPAKIISIFEEYKAKVLKDRNDSFILSSRNPSEWASIPDCEKKEIKNKLKGRFGYLK